MPYTTNKKFKISNQVILSLYSLVTMPPLFFVTIMKGGSFLTGTEIVSSLFGIFTILPIICSLIFPPIILLILNKHLCEYNGSPEQIEKVNKFLKQGKSNIIIANTLIQGLFSAGVAGNALKSGLSFEQINHSFPFLTIFFLYGGYAAVLSPTAILMILAELERPLFSIPYIEKYKTSSVRSRLLSTVIMNIFGLLCSTIGLSLCLVEAQDLYKVANAYVPT